MGVPDAAQPVYQPSLAEQSASCLGAVVEFYDTRCSIGFTMQVEADLLGFLRAQ
jgi:hypothetical protein